MEYLDNPSLKGSPQMILTEDRMKVLMRDDMPDNCRMNGMAGLGHPISCAIALFENMVDEDLVTQLDVTENVINHNLNLPWWVNSPLNCVNENSIVALNLNISISYLYCGVESILHGHCFGYQN